MDAVTEVLNQNSYISVLEFSIFLAKIRFDQLEFGRLETLDFKFI